MKRVEEGNGDYLAGEEGEGEEYPRPIGIIKPMFLASTHSRYLFPAPPSPPPPRIGSDGLNPSNEGELVREGRIPILKRS